MVCVSCGAATFPGRARTLISFLLLRARKREAVELQKKSRVTCPARGQTTAFRVHRSNFNTWKSWKRRLKIDSSREMAHANANAHINANANAPGS